MLFNLFKSKETKNKGSQYLSLKVREIIKETADTVTIYFEQPEPYLDYKPGQYLTVILDINGKEERRSYSLCTSPYVDPYPGITVKKIKDGLVSNFLNDKIRPGKSVEVMKPMGHFTMDYHSQNKRHVVMVTGGSGITPIMGITKSLLVNEPNSRITLLYCSRSEDQIIFKGQLLALEDKYPGKLQVIHNLTQPSDNWAGLKGRIDSERIKEILKQSVYPEAEKINYLTCGPQGLMETFLTTLESMGVNQNNIIKESFFKAPTLKTEDADSPETPHLLTREVKVILEGEEYEFEVSPNETILEAGLKEEVDMPYSCQSGLCTSCRGKLLSGEVKMDEDAGLSENELKQGYILCCVSHPVSGDVKINIE
jgi:ring-1,2-phenylacetyl-CoA epoxidase subunit PaaE